MRDGSDTLGGASALALALGFEKAKNRQSNRPKLAEGTSIRLA